MIIRRIIWPKDRIEHIQQHNIDTDEVEEVCFGHSLVL